MEKVRILPPCFNDGINRKTARISVRRCNRLRTAWPIVSQGEMATPAGWWKTFPQWRSRPSFLISRFSRRKLRPPLLERRKRHFFPPFTWKRKAWGFDWHFLDEALVAVVILDDLDAAILVPPLDHQAELVNGKSAASICEDVCHVIPRKLNCLGIVFLLHNLCKAGFIAMDRILRCLLPDI